MQLAHNWLTEHTLQEILDVNPFGYDHRIHNHCIHKYTQSIVIESGSGNLNLTLLISLPR